MDFLVSPSAVPTRLCCTKRMLSVPCVDIVYRGLPAGSPGSRGQASALGSTAAPRDQERLFLLHPLLSESLNGHGNGLT